MKTAICLLFLTIAIFISCDKNNGSNETIQPGDLTASVSMANELSEMQQALSHLSAAQNGHDQHHWDSIYHHHDSLFWHHHQNYHHDTYTHDDHSHHWTAYDPAVDHSHHYHHSYPGHSNDSLITTPNNHHHSNCDHHSGHHICHHHTMDSLHHAHNTHHP